MMRRYLIRFCLYVLALLGAVALLTVTVDPYDYWGTPTIEGVNRYRPASGKHLGVVKLRQYARGTFKSIVAGNSRVDVGIDPDDPAWPRALRPVYNLGLPGAATGGVVDAVIRAADIRRPQAIFLAVDFVDFRIDESEWRRAPAPRPQPAQRWREIMEVTLSLDALTDSLSSLAVQQRVHPPHILPNGFNSLAEYRDIVATEGHHALFEQRNRENVANYVRGPKAVWHAVPGASSDWAALDRLAAYARARDIRLVLFTYPYHAELRLGLRDAGLAPAYADWLRRLARWGDAHTVPVHDFSRLSPLLMESVPAAGDRTTQLAGYWEAGHFKAFVGHRMIGALVSNSTGLRADTVGAQLAADAHALAEYARSNPDSAARVAAAAAAARLPSPAR